MIVLREAVGRADHRVPVVGPTVLIERRAETLDDGIARACGVKWILDGTLDRLVVFRKRSILEGRQWGKEAPTRGDFKWVLQEGIWVRNYS